MFFTLSPSVVTLPIGRRAPFGANPVREGQHLSTPVLCRLSSVEFGRSEALWPVPVSCFGADRPYARMERVHV